MSDFPDLPSVNDLTGEEDERHVHRFSRLVAIAIVLATLAAAAAAFLQASARRTADDAGSQATDLATTGLAARHLADQAAYMLVDRYGLAQQQLTRAAQAEAQADFGPASARPGAEAERARWLTVAAQTQHLTGAIAASYGLPPITADGSSGPRLDPNFPERYLAASRLAAYQLIAERDAANQEGAEADSQVARSAIVLTVLAVSVFLFGYSLTPYAGRGRLLVAGVGAGFLMGGTVWGAVIAADAPRRPPDRAAAAFAAGSVVYYSGEDTIAVRDFTRVVQAFPEYAQAYNLRARAEFAAGSPQLDIPLSLTTRGALSAAAADDQRAVDHGDDDSGVILNAGYDLFALGLDRSDPAMMRRGLRYSIQARAARPSDPLPAYNVAVTLLALGRVSEATAAYREAAERTVYSDVAAHVHRNDINAEEADLAGALTDLASVQARRGPRLRRTIDDIEAQIVAPITRDSYAEVPFGRAPQNAAATGVRLAVGPAFAQFTLVRSRHLDVSTDDLSAQWYAQAPGGLGWNALPDVSGAFSQGTNGSTVSVRGDGAEDTKSYLAAAHACLSPGQYRLDLYDDGRLITQAVRTVTFPALVVARLLDLGVGFCRPAQWVPIPARAPGLIDGYTSPDHRAGVLVLSINRDLVAAGPPSAALDHRLLAEAISLMRADVPAGLDAGRDASRSFMALPDALVRAYRYPNGSALAGAGESPTGQMIVAIAFGPSSFTARRGRAIFDSLTLES